MIVSGPAKVYDRADTASPVIGSLTNGSDVLIQSGRYGMVWITYDGNARAGRVEGRFLRAK